MSDPNSQCRSCGAPIRWERTKAGKLTPVNEDGSAHWATCPDARQWRHRPDARPITKAELEQYDRPGSALLVASYRELVRLAHRAVTDLYDPADFPSAVDDLLKWIAPAIGEEGPVKRDKIPSYVLDQYDGLHGFRRTKRAQVRAVERAVRELQLGCAFLPTGTAPVGAIMEELALLRDELSVKRWGR